ncbi:hypothetical protein EJ08DRAFT_739134 [Tothia fuscella]|uniref:F-box domain-containing protein n=1 Tax=Tothia fuscella TaxID=1048955 RepID=A0A9P4NFE1_9PEZI|nr:hypothetical protein EJ08DRAFT_739134 [Tothia fuscella]
MASTFDSLAVELKQLIADFLPQTEDVRNMRLVSKKIHDSTTLKYESLFKERTIFMHPLSFKSFHDTIQYPRLAQCVKHLTITTHVFENTTQERGRAQRAALPSDTWIQLHQSQDLFQNSGMDCRMLEKLLRSLPKLNSISLSGRDGSSGVLLRKHHPSNYRPSLSTQTSHLPTLFSKLLSTIEVADIHLDQLMIDLPAAPWEAPAKFWVTTLGPRFVGLSRVSRVLDQLTMLTLTLSTSTISHPPHEDLGIFIESAPNLEALRLRFQITGTGTDPQQIPFHEELSLAHLFQHRKIPNLVELKIENADIVVGPITTFLYGHSFDLKRLRLTSCRMESELEWKYLISHFVDPKTRNINIQLAEIHWPRTWASKPLWWTYYSCWNEILGTDMKLDVAEPEEANSGEQHSEKENEE